MSEQEKTELSPSDIVDRNYYFEIPLYQRIFEWEEENIKQLLQDLWTQYNKYKLQPQQYFIGAFTCKPTSNESPSTFDLLDGQQRITALMIIASVLKDKDTDNKWKDFIYKNEKFRIRYVSRPKDEYKLKELCGLWSSEPPKSLNTGNSSDDISRMKRCKDGVEAFLNAPKVKDDLKNFSKYIYQNLTIIKTSLPADYTHQDIFQYFDRFNTPSPNLENYEIVKFKLLEGLGKYQKLYTKLLEAAINMDKCLIRKRRQRGNKDEAPASINTRFTAAISFALDKSEELNKEYRTSTLNDVYLTNDENNKNEEAQEGTNSKFSDLLVKLFKEDTPWEDKIKKEEKENNHFFSTPFFMLFTLYIKVVDDQEKKIKLEEYSATNFFDKSKIIKTFNQFFFNGIDSENEQCEKKKFIRQLILYRLLLDKYFIIKDKDKHYKLNDDLLNGEDSTNNEKLKQYEAMLFFSHYEGNYYKWLVRFLSYIKENINKDENLESSKLLTKLKSIDNDNIKDSDVKQQISKFQNIQNSLNALTYGNIDRYWFYRLDYYLWEEYKNDQQSTNNQDKTWSIDPLIGNFINGYYFRALRSIEHVDPQNPNTNDGDINTLKDIDQFGNLALISSSTNSGLGRKSFHQKIGKIIDRIHGGSYIIESLKLLHIFTYDKWNNDSFDNHTTLMIKVLTDSFDTNNNFDANNNDVWQGRELKLTNLFNGNNFEKKRY